jgi:very-short-patch-repair endonuclease
MTITSENTMHYGATAPIFENAKHLRDNQTLSEIKLWKHLNKNQLGYKFRRQHPISEFIADFYCHQLKLVIEVDGEYHLDKEQIKLDTSRTNNLKQLGLTVIRFTDDQVFDNIESVIITIKNHILILK